MTITDFGSGYASAINNPGDIAGGINGAPGHSQPVVWNQQGEVIATLEVPTGTFSAQPTAINARREVAGGTIRGGKGLALVWDRDGKATFLPLLPGGTINAAASINDRGTVAGAAYLREPGQYGPINVQHAVLWDRLPSGEYTITRLPELPGSAFSVATGINDRGQVVGNTYANGASRAMTWDQGQIVDLGFLPGGRQAEAMGINNRGDIVGTARTATRASHAVVWTHGGDNGYSITDLGALPGSDYSRGNSINDRGDIAGFGASTTAAGGQTAILWTPTHRDDHYAVADLGQLPGGTSSEARSINNKGQVVGISSTRRPGVDEDHAVRWNTEG